MTRPSTKRPGFSARKKGVCASAQIKIDTGMNRIGVRTEEELSAVLDAVMALPEKYREAVYLYYYEGYSVREVAALLGRSEAAVSAHLSRGRKSLRQTLGGEFYEQKV